MDSALRLFALLVPTTILLAAPGGQEVVTVALPTPRGVLVEARAVIAAPAERIAGLVADPASFVELFPAERAEVRGHAGAARVVEVVMREPWPIGEVRWTETVTRRTEESALVVDRQARPGGFFRHMQATWRIAPLSPERSAVVYRVSMELGRWVPIWMLRRGNLSGIRKTMGRLAAMLARGSAVSQRAVE